MRIIGGRFRSRVLVTPAGLGVRPTPDRLRETLFDVLQNETEGIVFVDAYAGSGAVGLEALSRGAQHVVLVERSREALAAIQKNVQALQVAESVTIRQGTAARWLPLHPADIVFVDPPYREAQEYAQALRIAQANLLIAQHDCRLTLDDVSAELNVTRRLKQGSNCLTFYRVRP